ncbi:PTST protein [Nymphaea thermarum]|nr:PTST protein [Nymphaea thermarum]
MAFHQCHLTLYIGSSTSFKCHSTFLIPFPCRKRPTHVSFLPALNSTGLGLTVGNGAVSRESKVLGDFDLENEIFEFMNNSEKPNSFPTKEELMAAGRVDLVNAILAEDGWLSAGWVEEEERNVLLETGTGNGYALRNSVDGLPSYSLPSYSSSVVSKSSSLGRLTEVEHSSEGIEGILSRLEKERATFYPLESRKRDETRLERERTMEQTRYSWGNLTKMYGGPLHRPSKCRNSLEKLHDLCEAWEFQENEIMKSHAKLRATRAKLSILEGKMALKIMEAQKVAEGKRSQIEEGQCLLSLLRTTSIVWSNSGDDVLLVGSFDGWTSQRRMERTSSGVFVLNLKLYPGRYEIKFIVDGMWRVDPLRTVLSNNGHENNLLVVS